MIIFLIFSYIILVFLLLKNIDTECLKSYRGGFFTNALSITIVSFAFHPILPTISKYLKYNIHNITCAIILGGFIPIIVYSIWETIFLGVIPITGNISISIAYKEGIAMPSLLLPILNNPCSTIIICIFSLTSILTSFLGVSIASIDFFIDAFSIKKNRKGILKAMIFTYFPPIFFSYKLKKGFIVVLDYAGVFVIILIGILPFLMIYNLKYKKRKTMQFVFISNTYTMFIGILVYLSIILFILAKNIKLIEIIN
jgi:tyrosine-specific transport protein